MWAAASSAQASSSVSRTPIVVSSRSRNALAAATASGEPLHSAKRVVSASRYAPRGSVSASSRFCFIDRAAFGGIAGEPRRDLVDVVAQRVVVERPR